MEDYGNRRQEARKTELTLSIELPKDFQGVQSDRLKYHCKGCQLPYDF